MGGVIQADGGAAIARPSLGSRCWAQHFVLSTTKLLLQEKRPTGTHLTTSPTLANTRSLLKFTPTNRFRTFLTVTMDMQSLESRLEGISVNDENHDQHAHKAKVHRRRLSNTKNPAYHSYVGIDCHFQPRRRRRSQSTEASTAKVARQCHQKLAVFGKLLQHDCYNCKDYPPITSCTEVFRIRIPTLRSSGYALINPSSALITQTISPRHVRNR